MARWIRTAASSDPMGSELRTDVDRYPYSMTSRSSCAYTGHVSMSSSEGTDPGSNGLDLPGDAGLEGYWPTPPEQLVHRRQLDQMAALLCDEAAPGGEAAGAGVMVAFAGPEGSGKTTLALALGQDPRVRRTFSAGVVWISLGQGLDPAARERRILEGLRRQGSWRALAPADDRVTEAALRAYLERWRVLVVLDGACEPDDLALFSALGGGTAVLVTTSRRALVPSDCRVVTVDVLEQEHGRRNARCLGPASREATDRDCGP